MAGSDATTIATFSSRLRRLGSAGGSWKQGVGVPGRTTGRAAQELTPLRLMRQKSPLEAVSAQNLTKPQVGTYSLGLVNRAW